MRKICSAARPSERADWSRSPIREIAGMAELFIALENWWQRLRGNPFRAFVHYRNVCVQCWRPRARSTPHDKEQRFG